MSTMISEELAGVADGLMGRERKCAAGLLGPDWAALPPGPAKSPDEKGSIRLNMRKQY
jgi:hypothetical protein